MLLAQHTLMQNEAIMGLNLLTVICPTESEELLIKADFGRNMCELFARSRELDVHIMLNALSLLNRALELGIPKIYPKKKELFDRPTILCAICFRSIEGASYELRISQCMQTTMPHK